MRPIDADHMKEELLWGNVFLSAKEVNALVDLIDNQPTLTPPNEWISVDEKLPENGQIVLFHQKDGFIYCAEYFAGNELISPAWFIDNDSWEAKVVTHWMPLPEPPGEMEKRLRGVMV